MLQEIFFKFNTSVQLVTQMNLLDFEVKRTMVKVTARLHKIN